MLFVAGSLGSAFATGVEALLLFRVLLGVAVGIASYTAPLYLSEMASENVRGKMISMYQLMVTLGIVLAFLSDTWFSYSGNWRAMLGVLAHIRESGAAMDKEENELGVSCIAVPVFDIHGRVPYAVSISLSRFWLSVVSV